MADTIDYINPYESYELTPLASAEGTKGSQLLNNVQSLQVGFGSKVLRIDRDGLWMGAEGFAAAPFSVDMLGNMTATSLDLSDYLQVGDSLADLQGIIVSLDDIDDDLGTITAGNLIGVTVTGGTIRTASSGTRVQMTGASNRLDVYSGSTRRMSLDADSLEFYNSSGSKTADITASSYALEIDTTGGAYGGWIFNASYGVYFDSGGADPVMLINDAGVIMQDGKHVRPSGAGGSDLGTSTVPWGDLYVEDIHLPSGGGGYIFYPQRIYWYGQSTNPSGDGTMVYYSSGGTEGLRMQFGGSDFQFDASGV